VLVLNIRNVLTMGCARRRLGARQKIEPTGAVTEPLRGHAKLGHQAQRQIRQWRALGIPEVTIPLNLLVSPADDKNRDVVVVVGGEGGIRTLWARLESASYRFYKCTERIERKNRSSHYDPITIGQEMIKTTSTVPGPEGEYGRPAS